MNGSSLHATYDLLGEGWDYKRYENVTAGCKRSSVFFFFLLQKALLFLLGERLRQVSRVVNKLPSSCRKGLQAEALTPGGLPAIWKVEKVGAVLAEPQACRSMKADFSCFSLSSMASAASWVLPCSFWVKHEGVKTRNRLPYWLPAGSALASQVE